MLENGLKCSLLTRALSTIFVAIKNAGNEYALCRVNEEDFSVCKPLAVVTLVLRRCLFSCLSVIPSLLRQSCRSIFCMWQMRHRGEGLWEIACWVTGEETGSLFVVCYQKWITWGHGCALLWSGTPWTGWYVVPHSGISSAPRSSRAASVISSSQQA